MLARQYVTVTTEVAAIDKRIHAWHRSCCESRRLEEIPGIGPIVATALVAEIGDWKQFRSGRNLAAWIGLVPKQHSTGGKERLGQHHQARQSLLAMVAGRRCHGRHQIRTAAWHEAALAHTNNGAPTDKGRRGCAGQQDRTDGLGDHGTRRAVRSAKIAADSGIVIRGQKPATEIGEGMTT